MLGNSGSRNSHRAREGSAEDGGHNFNSPG